MRYHYHALAVLVAYETVELNVLPLLWCICDGDVGIHIMLLQ